MYRTNWRNSKHIARRAPLPATPSGHFVFKMQPTDQLAAFFIAVGQRPRFVFLQQAATSPNSAADDLISSTLLFW